MDTRHLHSFLKIAEWRSISRAAESLGIAQPSLSQQLLRLEDEVGLKLFRRTARGVTLTEAGRIFQEHARHILFGTEKALEDVRQLNSAAAGQVVFAVPPSVSLLIGVPLIDAIKNEAPHVSVRLVDSYAGAIRGWLETGKIDLGIVYDLGSLRHLAMRRLVSEELFLVGPRGAFTEDDGELQVVPPEQLREFPLITSGRQHGLRQLLEREGARLGFSLSIAHEIDSLPQTLALVERGHGYSILPQAAVVESLATGRNSWARVGEGVLRRTLCLVRNPNHVVSYASVRVEDLAMQVVERLVADGVWQAAPEDINQERYLS